MGWIKGVDWAGVAKASVPEGAPAAWGARAIWDRHDGRAGTLGFLGDRQGAKGDPEARGRLQAFLDTAMAGIQEGFARAQREGWRQSSADVRVLFDNDQGTVVGTPNGSHGYVYLAAWLKEG